MNKIILVLLICISSSTYAQINHPFFNFYAENFLLTKNAGMGNTGIATHNDLSGTLLNPATINIEKDLQVIGGYQFKNSIPWLTELGVEDLSFENKPPEMMIGVGYKINKNFHAGLLYYNQYSIQWNLGDLIITDEFGNPIYTVNDAYVNYNTNNISLPVSYKSKYIDAGVDLTLINYNSGNKTYSYSAKSVYSDTESFWKFIPKIGIIIKPLEILSIGLSFFPQYQENVKPNFVGSENTIMTYFPAVINAGTEIRLNENKLNINFDYSYKNTSRQSDDFKDINELRIGAGYKINNILEIRAGFFNIPDIRVRESSSEFNDISQYYLTIGGSISSGGLAINIAYLNSTLLSNTYVANNRIVLGVTYDLSFTKNDKIDFFNW